MNISIVRYVAAVCTAILSGACFADVTKEQAIQIAAAYLPGAARGVLSEPTLATPDPICIFRPSSEGDPTDQWLLQYVNGLCHVRKSDGKIMGFVLHPDDHPELEAGYPLRPVLSLAQITTLANQYLAAAGWPDTYVVKEWKLVFPAKIYDAEYSLELRAVRGGVMVFDSVYVSIEPTTGFLRDLTVYRDPPIAPANLSPAVSVESAIGTMGSYALTAKGLSSLIEIWPITLTIWRPEDDFLYAESFLTPEQRQAGMNNQGMLVYFGLLGELATYSESHGYSMRRFFGFVDAQTGALLAVQYWDDWGTFGAGPSRRVRTPMKWDLSPGQTSVLTKHGCEKVLAGDVASAGAPVRAPAGVPFFLRRGRLMLACGYDPATGLLWQTQKGKRVYGKPNAQLRKAILSVIGAKEPSRRRAGA